MSRQNHLEMSSFDSLSLDRDPWLREVQPPKKVCSKGIWTALGHLTLFHLPAVAITLAILALYIAQVRWPHPTVEQLSILQFVAKGHEILILVSLADVLMYRVYYGLLVDKNGVPLGFLSSPFQLGAPILYLFSWELWSAILQPRANHSRGRPRITGFIIIVVILLSLAAAPLSAIAIIPREGWQQVHLQPKKEEIITYVRAQLYETDLDSKHVELYEVFATSSSRRMANFTYTNYNLDTPGSRLISLTMDFEDLESSSIAIATTPMSAVADQLDRYWREKPTDVLTKSYRTAVNSSEVQRWKQPLIAVECSPNKTAGSQASFSFQSNITNNNVLLDADKDSGFKKLLKVARRKKSPQLGYQIVDLPDSKTSSISAAMGEEEGLLELELCRIHARWEEADVWVEEGKSSNVQSQLDSPLFRFSHHFGDSAKAGDTIKMKEEWLTALGERIGLDGGFSNETNSTYQQIRDFCYSGIVYSLSSDCLHITLAAHLTDALSQTGPTYGFSEGNGMEYPTDSPPDHNDTIIHQTYFLGGHVYDFKTSRTIPFAFSVLLLHVLVVLVHVVTVLLSRHPWHVSSWSSFGQILVLALRSKASDELGSVGGGVESSQTWNTTAAVRVVGDEGRIEMMLRQRSRGTGQDQQLEDGGDNERGVTQVQPDIKYH
ncbi:uncharacterized protein NECHADRAFT_105657 [Fusarium vanettenii 77-13-4]|uniref:Uncharacterized protein n=1 Tax=Fusarium vanettenii (strain ATCC MYA-4622 / CBS 123669 / FGSC 9596 / NRRL 45880 / 77-13-4) TaxID=660122 RepID=C7ZLE9_FUSV7|nr:uncharacterized protein NECHADRAFT_105657 [Fusarium vanettenii 77-13-4]EEU35150.1 hypothetical protein NECHADRAFT_105657 [Fusarium vanettenii 77-13-4]